MQKDWKYKNGSTAVSAINNFKRLMSSELGVLAVTIKITRFSLMMEAIRSFEMSVLIRAIQLYISEDGILHRLIKCFVERRVACQTDKSVTLSYKLQLIN
jgi:hypothetical protein